MIARYIALLFVLAVQTVAAPAQDSQQAVLAYRFTPGQVTQEQMRLTGELRIGDANDSTTMKIDAAALFSRRVTAVSSSGEGTLTIRTASTVVRISGAGHQIFSLQDTKGISNLVDGVPLPTGAEPPKEILIRVGRGGQMAPAPTEDNDPAGKFVGVMPTTSLAFPDHSVTIGERWRGSLRMPFPHADTGGTVPRVPDLAVTTESELRSLQTENGHLVATVVTTTQESPNDASSRQNGTVVSRFDVTVGELLDSQGDFTLDLQVRDTAPQSSADDMVRLTGRIHFTTAVLSSDTTLDVADAPPKAVTPPPLGQDAQLGQAHDGWSLTGGEILRYYGSPSEQACCSDCENDSACQAYTWVKPAGYQPGDPPVCYLMRSYQSAVAHRCCIAATRGPFPGQ